MKKRKTDMGHHSRPRKGKGSTMMRSAKAAQPGRSGSDRRRILDITNSFRLKNGSKKGKIKDSIVDAITGGEQTIADVNRILKAERELNHPKENDNG